MNEAEIIKKLKDKEQVRAFGLCSREEQAIYEKARTKNCMVLDGDGNWRHPWDILSRNADFSKCFSYAINEDWHPPEPRHKDMPVYVLDGACWVDPPGRERGHPVFVMSAASLATFAFYFYYLPDGTISCLRADLVASYISSGKNVFGKFRKE